MLVSPGGENKECQHRRCCYDGMSSFTITCVASYVTPEVSDIAHRKAMRIVVEVGQEVQSCIETLRNLPGLGLLGPRGGGRTMDQRDGHFERTHLILSHYTITVSHYTTLRKGYLARSGGMQKHWQ